MKETGSAPEYNHWMYFVKKAIKRLLFKPGRLSAS
jgi:hypothetical protein